MLRRLLVLLAALGPVSFTLTCSGRDAGSRVSDGPAPVPLGRLIAPDPVTCAPSEDWTPAEEGGWRFRGIAEVACWLDDPPPRSFVLRFRPRPPTGRQAFRLAWDGFPLADGPVRAGEELVAEVPASRLGPGRHLLTLQRFRTPGDGRDPVSRFEEIALRAGGGAGPELDSSRASERLLDPAGADRLHRLAGFLLSGATGAGGLRSAGWLLAGPADFEVELPPGPARRFRTAPENLSADPATLRIELAGETRAVALAPGERGRLEIEVPAGRARLLLAADGAPGGLFLFGAPRLVAVDGGRPRDPARSPIVLVTLDTTRRDALGAYGAPAGATPHLDRFAATATVYEDALSTTSWTLPSHLSMFTGLYPSRHGLGVSRRRLPEELHTLAGLLRRRGYSPAGVAGGLLMASRTGGARDFLLYRDPLGGLETPADRVTDFAIELLDELDGEVPFLFVNYFDPHHPYEAPPAFQERAGVPEARRRLRSPAWRRAAAGDGTAWERLVTGEAELTEAGLAWLRAVYRAEVGFMDRELGRLVAELERRGLWDDALAVVVADHGELLGEGGYLTHSLRLDPELVEVPLLVKAPGQRRGRRVAGVVSVADLFPTLLAAAGAEAPSGDGRRLDPLTDRPAGGRGRAHVLFEEHAARNHPLTVEHLRIADHLWGYQGSARRAVVWRGGAECRRRGRGGAWRTEACPDDGARVLAALLEALGHPPADGAAEAGELSEDQRAALEALGYL